MKGYWLAAALGTAAAAWAGASVPAAPDPFAPAKKAFDVHCLLCHGPDARGDEETYRMYRVPAGHLDLVQGGAAEHTEAQLAQAISEGKGKMKPFKKKLAPEDIQALARYLVSLRPNKPAPPQSSKRS